MITVFILFKSILLSHFIKIFANPKIPLEATLYLEAQNELGFHHNNIGIVITFLLDWQCYCFYECLHKFLGVHCPCSFHCFIMAFYCSNMDISNLSIFCCLFGNCSLVHSGHITDCINNACCIFEIYTTYCQTFQSCSNIGHILFCLYWSFVQCFRANNFTFKTH